MELVVLDSLPERVPTSAFPLVNKNFPVMLNTRLLKAARGEEVDRIPVWVMRQAGRYLPEFLKVKESHEFFEICTTPALACEVTLQPLRRFPLDASIIFSDILVVPQFMGLEVVMTPGKGPTFPMPLNVPEDISRLHKPDPLTAFEPYLDSIYLTRHSIKGLVPLIGFTGGPFTLFTYMVEGGGSNTFTKSRKWIFAYPEETKRLLDMITDVACEFLLAQICSGAQILQIFESHAGLLGPADFQEFILPYLVRIADFLKLKGKENPDLDVPLIIFAKDAGFALEMLSQTSYDVISLDWTIDIEIARKTTEKYGKTIQGNLDPASLYSAPDQIASRSLKMITTAGKSRYIANLGHGIYPDTLPSHLQVFIDTVHSI